MESVIGAVYFGAVIALIVLICASPALIVIGLIRNSSVQKYIALMTVVIASTTYIAVVVYAMVPARYFVDDPLRGTNDSFWEMHGEELMYAERHPRTDPQRQHVEQQVADDRRQFVEHYLLGTIIAGASASSAYGLYIQRQR